jgi:hypothetical protein
MVDAEEDVHVGGVAGEQVPPAVQLQQGRHESRNDGSEPATVKKSLVCKTTWADVKYLGPFL